MRKSVEMLLFIVIGGFVISAVLFLLLEVSINTDPNIRKSFFGAFAGAFFAFLFVRLGTGLTKIYDRLAKNQTTLVCLQHNLNDCMGVINDNIYLIEKFHKIFDGYHAEVKDQKLFGNELHQIPINKELVVQLTNMEFINEVYSLHVSIRKLNDSMKTMNRMMEQTTSAFIEQKIDHKTYAANLSHYKPTFTDLSKFLSSANDDAIKAFATARVLLRDEVFLSRIIRYFMPSSYTEKQNIEINVEFKRVKSEIEHIRKKGQEKIQDVMGN